MVARALFAPRFDESDEFADFDDESQGRESGTRHIARRVTPSPELLGLEREASAPPKGRESQRPTIPVPATASLVGYLESPPRIEETTTIDVGHVQRVAITMRAVPSKAPARLTVPDLAKPTAAPPPRLPRRDDPSPVAPTTTLRLRLTPYAREHAQADGDTDDTPGAMLDYLRMLGSVDRVPYVTASMNQILMAKLDHREGFVLSLVDGRTNIDALLDASPMPTHKTLRILHGLRASSLIAVKDAVKRA
jgi:hypothetical protein